MIPRDIAKRAAGYASVLLNRSLRPARPQSVGILVYHRIAPIYDQVAEPTWNVTPSKFREQLVELRQRGFEFLPLRDVLRRCEQQQSLPPRTTVITFDDGYGSVYLNAWPVLRELQIPATIFLNTAYLDSEAPFPFDPWAIENAPAAPVEAFRPLSIRECREMQDSRLIELGAHTHTHRDFRRKTNEFRADLQLNLDALREQFGVEKATFAFPYGRVSLGFAGGELAAVAREMGVLSALTTECTTNAPGDDPFNWGRFNVYQWDSGATLEAKLSGCYGWAPKLQDLVTNVLRRSR